MTDRSVAETCMAVGFHSVGSFTTSFTRAFGRSPTAYRASFPPAARYLVIPKRPIRPSFTHHRHTRTRPIDE